MLGRLTALLLLGSFLAITNKAHAEPMSMPIVLTCDSEPGAIIHMVQEKYGEAPFFVGEGLFMSMQGKWNKAQVLSTANPTSGTFSIILVEPFSGMECMLLVGSELAPAGGTVAQN